MRRLDLVIFGEKAMLDSIFWRAFAKSILILIRRGISSGAAKLTAYPFMG